MKSKIGIPYQIIIVLLVILISLVIGDIFENYDKKLKYILDVLVAIGTIGAAIGAFHAIKNTLDMREEDKKDSFYKEFKTAFESNNNLNHIYYTLYNIKEFNDEDIQGYTDIITRELLADYSKKLDFFIETSFLYNYYEIVYLLLIEIYKIIKDIQRTSKIIESLEFKYDVKRYINGEYELDTNPDPPVKVPKIDEDDPYYKKIFDYKVIFGTKKKLIDSLNSRLIDVLEIEYEIRKFQNFDNEKLFLTFKNESFTNKNITDFKNKIMWFYSFYNKYLSLYKYPSIERVTFEEDNTFRIYYKKFLFSSLSKDEKIIKQDYDRLKDQMIFYFNPKIDSKCSKEEEENINKSIYDALEELSKIIDEALKEINKENNFDIETKDYEEYWI